MKVTTQIPSSTAFNPSPWPAMTVELLIFLLCMQMLTGKAMTYLDNQWPQLVRSLDDGRLEVDNNRCENALRPFVLGRKAWLFSDTPAGAETSARLYGLVETAKADGCEPYAYLRRVFADLPKATTLAEIEALLAWNVDRPPTQSVAA